MDLPDMHHEFIKFYKIRWAGRKVVDMFSATWDLNTGGGWPLHSKKSKDSLLRGGRGRERMFRNVYRWFKNGSVNHPFRKAIEKVARYNGITLVLCLVTADGSETKSIALQKCWVWDYLWECLFWSAKLVLRRVHAYILAYLLYSFGSF